MGQDIGCLGSWQDAYLPVWVTQHSGTTQDITFVIEVKSKHTNTQI